ncbi:MAG: hypothetical protein AAGE85_08350 [Pseudomonadota bacterium]
MKQAHNRGFPRGNPISNALVVVVGAIAMAASLVLGFFAFVILASAFLVLASIVGIRLWWFRRKMFKAQRESGGPGPQAGGSMIEGEYRVVVSEEVNEEGRQVPPKSSSDQP